MAKTIKVTAGQETALKILHGALSFLLAPLMAFFDAYLTWPTAAQSQQPMRPKTEYIPLIGGIAALIVAISLTVLFAVIIPAPVGLAVWAVIMASVAARMLASWITAEILLMPVFKASQEVVNGPGKMTTQQLRGRILLAGLMGMNLKNYFQRKNPPQSLEMQRSTSTPPTKVSTKNKILSPEQEPLLKKASDSNQGEVKIGSDASIVKQLQKSPLFLTRYLGCLKDHLNDLKRKSFASCSKNYLDTTEDTLSIDQVQLDGWLRKFDKNPSLYETIQKIKQQVEDLLGEIRDVKNSKFTMAIAQEKRNNFDSQQDSEEQNLPKHEGMRSSSLK